MDPNAYRSIFFDEAQEHLATIEAILLRLKPGAAAPDDLNAIFRAVHSIKGSAAMLGCNDMAALAHLQENLLDLLRKDERELEAADVQALLRAGDTLHGQALRHRGVNDEAPDSAPAEAMLQAQLARPRRGAQGAAAGPVRRHFAVRVGPLAEAVPPAELELMLTGLAELGDVTDSAVDNSAGGHIAFHVALEGTAADLLSVLALVVPPELVSIGDPDATPRTPPPEAATEADELFVRPEDLRRKRRAPEPVEALAPLAAVDSGFIRVAVEKVDQLVNLVGELVITEAMLTRSGELAADTDAVTSGGLADLSRHTRNLQQAVLSIRMLPISNVFARFPRLVHELSARLGKQVDLRFSGEATELDRGLIEKISDPLTHLVRNAVDHGIETPAARLARGKPAAGTLRLAAMQRGGNIVIEVADDGQGLDRRRILARAAERGVPISPDAPDAEVWQCIYAPGFSTAEQVTDVSGRGVGMDVVRSNILALGGTIELASSEGEGTTVRVSVPLTLAIMEAMTVSVAGETYVLPLASVLESVRIGEGDVHQLPGVGETLRVRGEYLPVVPLARLFPPRGAAGSAGIAVIVEADAACAALLVDELVGQQQVVVKSLEANFRKVPGLSGATVMGDGTVALILDVSHIVRSRGGRAVAAQLQEAA